MNNATLSNNAQWYPSIILISVIRTVDGIDWKTRVFSIMTDHFSAAGLCMPTWSISGRGSRLFAHTQENTYFFSEISRIFNAFETDICIFFNGFLCRTWFLGKLPVSVPYLQSKFAPICWGFFRKNTISGGQFFFKGRGRDEQLCVFNLRAIHSCLCFSS